MSQGANNNNNQGANKEQAIKLEQSYELPNIPEEDILLVENILKAMQSLGSEDSPICLKYKVKLIPTGYILRAFLPPADVYELDLDDLLFIKSISPSRIDTVCIARTAVQAASELVVRVLDHKQRIMITRSTTFSATRKRKWQAMSD